MIRVAYMIDHLRVGGAQRHLLEVVRGLDRNRYAPEMWSAAAEPGDLASVFERAGIPVRSFGITGTSTWIGDFNTINLYGRTIAAADWLGQSPIVYSEPVRLYKFNYDLMTPEGTPPFAPFGVATSGVGGWAGMVANSAVDPRLRNGALGFAGAMSDLPGVTSSGGTLMVFALPPSAKR